MSGALLAALASGGDLAIPMADFAAHIAPSEHYKGLAQDLRFNPEDITLREATAEPGRLRSALGSKLSEIPGPVLELRLESQLPQYRSRWAARSALARAQLPRLHVG